MTYSSKLVARSHYQGLQLLMTKYWLKTATVAILILMAIEAVLFSVGWKVMLTYWKWKASRSELQKASELQEEADPDKTVVQEMEEEKELETESTSNQISKFEMGSMIQGAFDKLQTQLKPREKEE